MMPQPNPSSPLRSDTQFSDAVPQALKALVDRYGVELLGDATRLRGLLQDECPQAKKEISVLLQALDERVPQDLLRVHSGEPISSLSPRLTRRLAEEKSLSEAASGWAVQAWALGLGVAGDGEFVLPQPAPAGEGAEAPAADPVTAANDPYGRGLSRPDEDAPSPSPSPWPPRAAWRQDRRIQGAGAVAVLAAIAGAAWWFMLPRLDIVRIEAAGVLVANGKPQPVVIDYEARNTQPRSAEVRFVRGDLAWTPAQWTVEVAADPAAPGRLAAGSLQASATQPVSATFEYTLVGADGQRSAPFQRTFQFAPPLVITQVQVPRALRVGSDFAVDIDFRKGGAEIVRVERKVIDSNVPWAQQEVSQPLKLDAANGRFAYRFEAFPRPARATIEFTLVDAAGQRSEPARVALNVGAAAPGRIGTITAIAPAPAPQAKGETSGIGAAIGGLLGGLLGHQAGSGRGRTAATIGGAVVGVWVGNEVEKRVGTPAGGGSGQTDTTVRFDDGSTQVIRIAGTPRWAVGDRVRWTGRELSPAN